MRMDAYYYSFESTGNESIDRILSAVAHAGKSFHHTESWTDDCSYANGCDGLDGNTPEEWIQNAALAAASEVVQERDMLRKAIRDIRDAVLYERFQLADAGMNNDQVNAVLGIIDDHVTVEG